MARQDILTSDTLAAGRIKLNAMMTELYAAVADLQGDSGSGTPTPTPGDTVVYGPQSIADTNFVQVNGAEQKIAGNIGDAGSFKLWLSSDATGENALLFENDSGFWKLFTVDNGQKNQIVQGGGFNPGSTVPFVATRDANSVRLLIDGAELFNSSNTTKTGTYARCARSVPQSVTITRLA